MKLKKNTMENIFAICIFTVCTGQLYINPFNSSLRFSFSVSALSLLLIYFKDIPIILVTNIVGISIFVFRSLVYIISHPTVPLQQVVAAYYGGAAFYIFFGMLFKFFNIREKINQPGKNIVFLWTCEIVANFGEILLTGKRIEYSFEGIISVMILIGIIRSIITVGIYDTISYYLKRYKKKEMQNKYIETVCFMANLKTELFFLKKSTVDIENAMNKCYELYKDLKKTKLGNNALSAAKDIHEIKKDYIRVLSGVEKALRDEKVITHMTIEDIFEIIRGNTQDLIELTGKNISILFYYEDNLITKEFYGIISVLNNLIINAIDAIEETGRITITQKTEGEECVFIVMDNGRGINEGDMPLIFKPGFSTKFDQITGEMSTGIGLTHVKHIVEDHFKGTIHVYRQKENGTNFMIHIPISRLIEKTMSV